MKSDEPERRHADVNPAARRDQAGEPRDDLARSDDSPRRERIKGYQDAALDPLDTGGIAE